MIEYFKLVESSLTSTHESVVFHQPPPSPTNHTSKHGNLAVLPKRTLNLIQVDNGVVLRKIKLYGRSQRGLSLICQNSEAVVSSQIGSLSFFFFG